MKVLVNFFVEVALCCSLLFCITCSTSDERIEDQSIKKEEGISGDRGEHFVVRALEQAYVILELSQLAKARSETPAVSEQAGKMIDGQLRVIDRLMRYALEHRFIIPAEAPEPARTVVKSLSLETAENFDRVWLTEISRLNLRLVMDFESYKREATSPVPAVIHESLATLRVRHDALGKYIATNQTYN